MPLSYGSIAGNLSSCIQHLSAVLSTTFWFAHVRSRSFGGDALPAEYNDMKSTIEKLAGKIPGRS
jgi:hypothetical protein